MSRYFIELSYQGTNYSGFQSQKNAHTVQAELEKAIEILRKEKTTLVGSSRTDTGVHALQNYFHFDTALPLEPAQAVYKLNAILPGDISIHSLTLVENEAHCRFDALNREYRYAVYQKKNPFLRHTAFYFPYRLDIAAMQQAAALLQEYADFTSFSKRNTQVKTFQCTILQSEWKWQEDCLVYHVKANRFLRGMVRALTGTMLKVGRSIISPEGFRQIIEAKDCTKASFAVPPHGLFLISVNYAPETGLKKEILAR